MLNKKQFFKKTNILIFIISNLVLVLMFALNMLCSDAKLELFCNSLNNYFKNPFMEKKNSPILRITKEECSFNDLFSEFYYTPNQSTLNMFRRMSSNQISLFRDDGLYFPCSFQDQTTYSINEKIDDGYYLDKGMYDVYFKNEVLPNREYLSFRFNSNGFIFISDTLADTLIATYDLPNYESLISDERYCKYFLNIDGVDTPYSVCINNIVFSNKKNGSRTKQLYGDFCLFFLADKLDKKITKCVEFDFKSDVYGTKEILKKINKMGYSADNCSFNFKLQKNNYHVSEKLDSIFSKIKFDNSYLYIEIFDSIIIFIIILLINNKMLKEKSNFYLIISLVTPFILLMLPYFVFVSTISLFSIWEYLVGLLIIFVFRKIRNEVCYDKEIII